MEGSEYSPGITSTSTHGLAPADNILPILKSVMSPGNSYTSRLNLMTATPRVDIFFNWTLNFSSGAESLITIS